MAARCTIVSVLTEERATASPAVHATSAPTAPHQGLLLVVSPPRMEPGAVHAGSGSWCAGSHLPVQRFHVKQSPGSRCFHHDVTAAVSMGCLDQRSRRSYPSYRVYSKLARGNGKHQFALGPCTCIHTAGALRRGSSAKTQRDWRLRLSLLTQPGTNEDVASGAVSASCCSSAGRFHASS
jgi:hypothetical protein